MLCVDAPGSISCCHVLVMILMYIQALRWSWHSGCHDSWSSATAHVCLTHTSHVKMLGMPRQALQGVIVVHRWKLPLMGANEGRSALIPSGNRCLDGEMVSACHERWLLLAEDIECWLAQGLFFSELRTIMRFAIWV